jgi:hypothetical protein
LPLRWHEPKTNLDVNERRMPIAKFAERIPAPETGSVIAPPTNVVFAVTARVIDAPIGKLHRVSVLAERVIVRLRPPFAEREIVKAEFGFLPGKVSATVLLLFAEVARVIVQFKVVRLLLAKLMIAKGPSVFFPNKVAKAVLPHLSDCGRNSSVATRWLVRSARNFGARSSLTPSFATACSCSSNVSRGWSLAEFVF